MHTSHGTLQGYNAQAIVDSKHQVIVHGEAIGKGLDNDNLPPVVDGAKENLESIGKSKNYFKGKILTADSSYHSVTNIAKCNEEKLDAYISDNKFRNRDKRFATRVGYRPRSKKFTFADFVYDGDKDDYKETSKGNYNETQQTHCCCWNVLGDGLVYYNPSEPRSGRDAR